MIFGLSYSGPELPVVVALLVLMLLVSEGGYRIGRAGAARAAEGMRSQVSVIITGTLALVALLLGFSLAMAVARFERLQEQLATTASSAPSPADRFAGVRPVRYRCDDGRDVLATFVQAGPGPPRGSPARAGGPCRQVPPRRLLMKHCGRPTR